MEQKYLWNILCGGTCSRQDRNKCWSTFVFSAIVNPNSCTNHLFIVSVDLLLLLIFLCVFIYVKISPKSLLAHPPSQHTFKTRMLSTIFNTILGLVYLGWGTWMIHLSALPIHGWMVMLLQGCTWLLLNLTVTRKKQNLSDIASGKLCSVLAFLFSIFLCTSWLLEAIMNHVVLSVKMALDIFCLPGAILMLFCAFQKNSSVNTDPDINPDVPYSTLQGEVASDDNVTPFSKAGVFSSTFFCWLNPLMKKGSKKIIEDDDIPQLRQADRAQTCYFMYMEQLNKRGAEGSSDSLPMISALFSCHKKEILVSGFFALFKVLSLLTGPLLLKGFMEVAEHKASFQYEAYVLTMLLFLAKLLESFSERQWCFRTRLIGLQVRSLLSAAVYRKQQKLSNAAKMIHSSGEIVNYVTVDAYKLGEFPFWLHQIWVTCLQLCLALVIVYYAVGLATIAALLAIILTVIVSSPLAKLQLQYHKELLKEQDRRLKAMMEALANIKVLKLYAWETHFAKVIHQIRKQELWSVFVVTFQKGSQMIVFWSSPVIVSAITFWACYLLGFPLTVSNVFTFMATLRCLQEPIRLIPEIAAVFIEAKVSLDRIARFLKSPELQNKNFRRSFNDPELNLAIFIRCTEISWATDASSIATLRDINLEVKLGERVAICGEVGSGKSTILSAVLGEIPRINGTVNVYGKIAYVSQNAWMQTGTIQENILFGAVMDHVRYQKVLKVCSLVKDLDMFPFGDLTEIGERGVNLSGGQKQRVQLARALYQDADVYLLDDPFSAVDAHTATSLFNEYVMGALTGKTVLLVTHQVDFLPAFDCVLLLSAGKVLRSGSYDQLIVSCKEFQELVEAHSDTSSSKRQYKYASSSFTGDSREEIQRTCVKEKSKTPLGDQLIKKEEREVGNTGLKPYMQYLSHGHGFVFCFMTIASHFSFIVGQLVQNYLLAVDLQSSHTSQLKTVTVYSVVCCILAICLVFRSFFLVKLSIEASQSIFSTISKSLFRAPMSFFDSTPLGRILSRVSSDLSSIDLDLAMKLSWTVGSIMISYSSLGLLSILSWPVLFLIIPMVYLSIVLQRYYFHTSKELMRITGITKSSVVSHLAESIAGAMTIRAFREEDRFFSKNLKLIDQNASAYFHNFSGNEWLIQRLEIPCAVVLSVSALAITLLPTGASSSGYVGMALSYGLSLNLFFMLSIQNQCYLSDLIVSFERLEQYMNIPSEAPEVIESNHPPHNWPHVGKVEISNLKVRYQPKAPFVLKGISCIIEGGHKVGIVGRTGSGKTTLINSLFRLVEPTEGKIIVDGLDISKIGLHDLRSHFGIIPQDPTLFDGSVRYNLDPLSQYTDLKIWKVLKKCQLQEVIQQKKEGLDALVAQDGSNWSMGQRQLFCLGRALLKHSKILVLDEATASIDNATDAILQKMIRTEFAECTVITVAHRIPTVMDCTKVISMKDGRVVEYDEPFKLMNDEQSLLGHLVKEYWSRSNRD